MKMRNENHYSIEIKCLLSRKKSKSNFMEIFTNKRKKFYEYFF